MATRIDYKLNERLAGKIRRYWEARGFIVNTRVEYVGFQLPGDDKDNDANPLCQVRSDMIAGMPRSKYVPIPMAAE